MNRQVRGDRGKSDPIDAELAGRYVLGGQVQGAPGAGTGAIKALRQLQGTRRSAMKARTQAANLLHALLLTAPLLTAPLLTAPLISGPSSTRAR